MRLCLKSFLIIFLLSCQNPEDISLKIKETPARDTIVEVLEKEIVLGADQIPTIVDLLENETVGIVANQTSVVGENHLVDSLLSCDITIKTVFSPEHGFRGDADAGASVESGIDVKTGLPIISLYGSNKKPTEDQLDGLTTVVFDIQDVGARFYTYISTLHYVMEACAEQNIKVVVLDRPNPNGHYVDGPIREEGFLSFVGMHPIPIVHGMTVGEIAKMINGEKWLKNDVQCKLEVVEIKNYKRNDPYSLPIAPSPNLRSDASITLYPSLCLFEGTVISVGRGTDRPFEVFGHPDLKEDTIFDYTFTPKPGYGSKHPKLDGQLCHGMDLGEKYTEERLDKIDLSWLLQAYETYEGDDFFTKRVRWFDLLAGTDKLRKQITDGLSEEEIRSSWDKGLTEFKEMRSNYLIYE
tara:strand:- start:166172 stop:167401 length:1230 start_codon:yes stop_codon:yes gene_type:complete